MPTPIYEWPGAGVGAHIVTEHGYNTGRVARMSVGEADAEHQRHHGLNDPLLSHLHAGEQEELRHARLTQGEYDSLFRREREAMWTDQRERCEVESVLNDRCPGVAQFGVRFDSMFGKVCGHCLPGQLHNALRRGGTALVYRLDKGMNET